MLKATQDRSAYGHELVHRNDLGWLPILFLVNAIGVLVLAMAVNAGRQSLDWAEPLYWVVLAVMFAASAARLTSASATRRERFGILLCLGIALYLFKILYGPLDFVESDEFAHLRTANDILATRHLFAANPLLPTSALFPGTEIITSALSSLTGLPIFVAGMIQIGLARCLMVASVFLFYEQVAQSSRVAGIATILYLCNPSTLYFEQMFNYEPQALPLMTFFLFLVAWRLNAPAKSRVRITLALLPLVLAVVMTHHITSYFMVGFLILYVCVMAFMTHYEWLRQMVRAITHRHTGESSPSSSDFEQPLHRFYRIWGQNSQPDSRSLFWLMIFALVACLTWMMFASQFAVVTYISPHLLNGLSELIRLIIGESNGRVLFQAHNGQVAPLLERLTGFASIIFVLVVLPFGLWHIWRNHRKDFLKVTFGVATLGYPASLAFRLTQSGAEASNRAAEFVFLALALVLAYSVVHQWLIKASQLRVIAFTFWITAIFLGGIVIGWAPWARLPGSFLVTADPRSANPESYQAAIWAKQFLGEGNRMVADRTNRQRMSSYGGQYCVTAFGDEVPVYKIYFSPNFGPSDVQLLHQGDVRYIVTDYRLTTGLPMMGFFFEVGEPGSLQRTSPMQPAWLKKFDDVLGINRIYDNGTITIYDAKKIIDAK